MSESESEQEELESNFDETELKSEYHRELRIKMNQIEQKAIEKIYLDAKLSELRGLMESTENITHPMLLEARKCIATAKKYQKKKVTSEYYFVTVSPKAEQTLESLRTKVMKYVGRRMVTGAMWAFEWNKNKQPHVHMIVHQLEYSDADFRKNTKNTFKCLVGNLACIDIRSIPTDWLDDKIAYIKGDKWDEEKQEMVDYDKSKRRELGMEQYYTIGTMKEALLDEASPVEN